MAIRTANKRAYLYGEGQKRQEWGLSLVVVNSRQGGCPNCAKYIGRVFIDDVYSGGKQSDGNYQLLSEAIIGGLFHPRCKDSTSTYYEGITTLEPVTNEEIAKMEERETLETKQQYAERQEKRFNRLAKYSLDEDHKRIYKHRAEVWGEKANGLNEILERTVENSSESGIIKSKNLAKTSDVFYYTGVVGEITPDSIINLLESNQIGQQTIRMLEEKGVKPFLDYGYHRFSHRGEQQGKNIKIFVRNIPNSKVAAQTVIHETTHLYFDIGQCQWAEAVCFAREKMFLTGRKLTIPELRYIVSLAKQAYPEFNWKKGGYGYKRGKRFN